MLKRWMIKYLRARGFVVFYLAPEQRECRAVCWLKEYQRKSA